MSESEKKEEPGQSGPKPRKPKEPKETPDERRIRAAEAMLAAAGLKESLTPQQFDRCRWQMVKMFADVEAICPSARKRREAREAQDAEFERRKAAGEAAEPPVREPVKGKPESENWEAALAKGGFYYKFEKRFDLLGFANLFDMPLEKARSLFESGRFFSQIGEEVGTAFGFKLFPHKDVGGCDGYFLGTNQKGAVSFVDDEGREHRLFEDGEMDFVSVKGLGKSKKLVLQLSALTGAGRDKDCDLQAVRDSVKLAKWICATDTERDGTAKFVLFPSKWALDWIENGVLTASGIGKAKLFRALAASADGAATIQEHCEKIKSELAEKNQAAAEAEEAAAVAELAKASAEGSKAASPKLGARGRS